MPGDQFPKREARGVVLKDDPEGLVQRDIEKLYRSMAVMGKKVNTSSLTMGSITITSITTTIADPGVDTKLPTEQAVREAINEGHGWAMLWAFFLGAA